ncbi:hypothetical protein FRC12_005495 [Ceratobasidium sp. 428]|nr:hypothetical protein FRC12_005495 [Ceratobasidium sp. 428]
MLVASADPAGVEVNKYAQRRKAIDAFLARIKLRWVRSAPLLTHSPTSLYLAVPHLVSDALRVAQWPTSAVLVSASFIVLLR